MQIVFDDQNYQNLHKFTINTSQSDTISDYVVHVLQLIWEYNNPQIYFISFSLILKNIIKSGICGVRVQTNPKRFIAG